MRGRGIRLTEAEVAATLAACPQGAILVGGQALALWVDRYNIARPPALREAITSDVDFRGTRQHAQALARSLSWSLHIPSMDNATPQSAKVAIRLANGDVKEIDFLAHLAGMDNRALARRSVSIEIPGIGILRVIEPMDLLESRCQNLLLLPEKRNETGVAQATLAIGAARGYILETLKDAGERPALRLLERVGTLAVQKAGIHAWRTYGVEILEAVPIEAFKSPKLASHRWPAILHLANRKRRR